MQNEYEIKKRCVKLGKEFIIVGWLLQTTETSP